MRSANLNARGARSWVVVSPLDGCPVFPPTRTPIAPGLTNGSPSGVPHRIVDSANGMTDGDPCGPGSSASPLAWLYSRAVSTSRKRYSRLKLRWRAAVGPARGRAGSGSESEVIVDHVDEHFEDLLPADRGAGGHRRSRRVKRPRAGAGHAGYRTQRNCESGTDRVYL